MGKDRRNGPDHCCDNTDYCYEDIIVHESCLLRGFRGHRDRYYNRCYHRGTGIQVKGGRVPNALAVFPGII